MPIYGSFNKALVKETLLLDSSGNLNSEDFTKAFCNKGRFSKFNSRFSIYLVLDDFAALKGCNNFMMQNNH